jgi:hypothetical protein
VLCANVAGVRSVRRARSMRARRRSGSLAVVAKTAGSR